MFKYSLKTAVGRFLLVSFLEGSSYLVLLFVAMPLKYLVGQPQMVRNVGMLHGLLFGLFLLTLVQAMMEEDWKWTRAAKAFGLSMLPFGTFWFESRYRKGLI